MGDDSLSQEDFAEGFARLRGDARAKDVYTMLNDVTRTYNSLTKPPPPRGFIDKFCDRMVDLKNDMETLSVQSEKLGNVFGKWMLDLGKGDSQTAAPVSRSAPTMAHSSYVR